MPIRIPEKDPQAEAAIRVEAAVEMAVIREAADLRAVIPDRMTTLAVEIAREAEVHRKQPLSRKAPANRKRPLSLETVAGREAPENLETAVNREALVSLEAQISLETAVQRNPPTIRETVVSRKAPINRRAVQMVKTALVQEIQQPEKMDHQAADRVETEQLHRKPQQVLWISFQRKKNGS